MLGLVNYELSLPLLDDVEGSVALMVSSIWVSNCKGTKEHIGNHLDIELLIHPHQ